MGKGLGFAAGWALVAAMTFSAGSIASAKETEKRIVLPSAVTPDHYRVEITPTPRP